MKLYLLNVTVRHDQSIAGQLLTKNEITKEWIFESYNKFF